MNASTQEKTMPRPFDPDAVPGHDVQPHAAHGDDAAAAPKTRALAPVIDPPLLTPVKLEERRLIHRNESARIHADAFREIRTRLLELGGARNFVTLVAPIRSGCGGSFVARNLAAAFAFDETKTAVLVDCDTRHPSQHRALGIDAVNGGLVDYLEHANFDLDGILYNTGVPRLRLIPAGSRREIGGEQLSSFRMRATLDSLRTRYSHRYLVLDGPAVHGSPDARILADLADFVVLVAGYGRVTPEAVSKAVSAFDPAKLAGVVFNQRP